MRRTARRFLAAAVLAVVGCRSGGARAEAPPAYEVTAVRFGTLPQFPVRGLVAGADSARRIDIAVMVWLVRGGGRTVMMDAGFHQERFLQRWKPADFVSPDRSLAAAGVPADSVTDIILSHIHWDHADGLDLFPRARVWMQRAEFEYYVDSAGAPRQRGIEPETAATLAELRRAGRLMLVDGDAREIVPGITVYTGGRHTWASPFAGVRTAAGTVVLASDNAYLYENLERHRPIAQTFDSLSNLQAQARMLQLAAAPRLLVPGHDPAVFERFPQPGHGVARIR